MRALLTGATGFLGRRVLCELVDAGIAVRCAVRPGSPVGTLCDFVGAQRWKFVETVKADLSRPEDCRRLVADCDLVYHCAAVRSGCPSHLVLNTVAPTRCLLEAAAEESVARVVLVSSLGVYGPQRLPNGSVLDENCPIDEDPPARDAYSYSKILQEEVAIQIAQCHNTPLVIVRPGVIFGDERGVLSDRIGLRFGHWLLRMGGRHPIPLTYVENCATAVALAGIREGLTDTRQIVPLNIVDDDLPTGREIVRKYRRSGQRIRVLPIPGWAMRPLAVLNEWYAERTEYQVPKVLTRHRIAAMWKPLKYSNQQAQQLLGWTPRISLDAAIDRTLARQSGRQS